MHLCVSCIKGGEVWGGGEEVCDLYTGGEVCGKKRGVICIRGGEVSGGEDVCDLFRGGEVCGQKRGVICIRGGEVCGGEEM